MTRPPVNTQIAGVTLPVHSTNTLIIGSGAAALNAALQLLAHGQQDIMLVTQRWGAGASNEAGSDKQTYYKLALAHSASDSPRQTAEDLFRGGCMHGDIALCEAQHSAQAFYHLVSRGVPFPHDRYGAYVGYRTDHDPRGRATSAGPLTSHLMCECLGRAVREAGVALFDLHQVVALLTCEAGGEKHVCGAVALDQRRLAGGQSGFVVFNAANVILATGGPGGMYRASVYPESQVGSTGLALAIGAVANNLTESQFGIASLGFRWNLSGSYQQVVPRYVSTDMSGGDAREFLNDAFSDLRTLSGRIFRKGYEWPFDSAKAQGHGSSLIDVLVYQETVRRGRRVYLDFTRNPSDPTGRQAWSLDCLDEEARLYLQRSGASGATPVARLRAMNDPAYELYRGHGIDLASDLLEVAVCAQHNNGGLVGNEWWESNIRHLFPIGEVNGTHGVRRPGGAALNAGQVGGLRAAMFIARRYTQPPPGVEDFARRTAPQIAACLEFADRVVGRSGGDGLQPAQAVDEIQTRMSDCAAILREKGTVTAACDAAWRLYDRVRRELARSGTQALPAAFSAVDLCLTHAVYLEALREYLERGGQSRGSYLVLNPRGLPVDAKLDEEWRFLPAQPADFVSQRILEVQLTSERQVERRWVDVRPIPNVDGWFETVWNDYRNDRIVC
ncbi:MAG TPA: FAD-binding protein [Phycisphaerae bacterium]|nr:FAD-binding protein [Phycisphaerae bacterium]HNU45075.1 FAD-binding protein [Phycisphaerae bacterium]